MMGIARLACLVGVVSQDCGVSGEREFNTGDFEVELEDVSALLQSSNAVQHPSTQDSQLAVSERTKATSGVLPKEHSMLQTAAVMERVANSAAPPAINLAELQVQLRNSDNDAIIAVCVMVGLPLLLGIACLLLVPRDGRSPRGSEDNAKSPLKSVPRSSGVPMTGESMASRAPTHRLSNLSLSPGGNGPEYTRSDARSFNLPRSDSLSSNTSLPPTVQRTICETGPLCQSLIVPKASGVTLGIEGDLLPCQQETVVDITMKDSNSNEGLLRLLVSETGKDRGMLLESVLKLPIAILDTGAAVAPTGAAPPPAESRQVLIRRDMDPTRAPYAVVRVEQGAQRVFKATRGTLGGGVGEPLLSVLIDMGGLRGNIVNPEGRLVASMETRSEAGGRTQRFLNICQGADSALVLCVVFAAIKLG